MNKAVHPTPADHPGLYRLWREAFGDSEADIDRFFATGFSPNRCLCIKSGTEIAAAAYWLDCSYCGGKLAYIYAVATVKQYRKQGLCHQLLEQIHSILLEQGYAGAVLVPGEPSLANLYRSIGYEHFGGVETLSCTAHGNVPIQALTRKEYAALRCQHLAPGAVIQEDESLSYLASYADFYAGMDFLLAATKNGNTLLGLELLGSTTQASGIVASLGCKEGTFRIPGATPFAMFRPLGNAAPPTYFGFAFD